MAKGGKRSVSQNFSETEFFMRTILRNLTEQQMKERFAQALSERKKVGDQLVEQLSKRPNFGGDKLLEAYKKDPDRVRNLAFVIRNTEQHLARCTESQISSTFHTTPDNVLRVIRLGYLNTSRQDAFWELGMVTANDVFYWLEPVYGKSLRGATAGKILYESSSYRSATDTDVYTVNETPNATIKIFTVTDSNVQKAPVSKHTVRVIVNGGYAASDDGAGGIAGDDITGTVDYATGATSVTFITAPAAGTVIQVEMGVALEDDDDLEITQRVDLSLRASLFGLREFPIYASFSKKAELLIGTTLDIDAEEAYLRAMADELKKSLDFQAFHMGYKQAKRNATVDGYTEFDLEGAVGESEHDRIQVLPRYIDKAGNKIYNKLLRGGVTRIFGGPTATGVLKGLDGFSDAGAMNQQGVYFLGSVGEIKIFRTPTTIVPDDELVCMYKNPEVPEDVYLMIGTLVPLHVTDKLEHANRQTEFGVASYGDMQILNKNYASVIRVVNG
jgi:hypothetical protein